MRDKNDKNETVRQIRMRLSEMRMGLSMNVPLLQAALRGPCSQTPIEAARKCCQKTKA